MSRAPRPTAQVPFHRVAVVLAGGGALGAYEVGVLRVLSKVGLEPAVVAGTSAGAINAVGWVAHGFRTEALERTWMRVRPPTIGMRWPTLALRAAGGLLTGLGLLLAVMSLLGSPEITFSRHLWGPAAQRHEALSVILDALAWGSVAMLGWLATKISRPAETWLATFEGAVDPVQTWRWFGLVLGLGAMIHLITWGTGFPWPHRFSATLLIVSAAAWFALRPGSGGDPLRAAIARWLPETRGRGLWGDAARKQLVQNLVRSGDSSLLTEGKTLLVMTALALDTGRIAHFYAGPEPGHGFVDRVERGLGEAIRLISPAQVIAAAVASSAIPIAFEPVRIAGREFIDAGQFSNQPLAAVYAARADAAIVVLLAPTEEPPRAQPDEHLLALGARLIEIGHWRALQQELRELPDEWSAARGNHPARVVVVAPDAPLPGHLIGFDPLRSKELIEFGERDAWRALRQAGWIEEGGASTVLEPE
jgi:predicted acylesterase/phospholipase RssA